MFLESTVGARGALSATAPTGSAPLARRQAVWSARVQVLLGIAGPIAATLLLGTPRQQWMLITDPRADVVIGAIAVLIAMAISWAALAWSLIVLTAAVAGCLPGVAGAVGRRLLSAVTPATVRAIVTTAAGLSISVGMVSCASPGPTTGHHLAAPVPIAQQSPISGPDAIAPPPARAATLVLDLDWPVTSAPTNSAHSTTAGTAATAPPDPVAEQTTPVDEPTPPSRETPAATVPTAATAAAVPSIATPNAAPPTPVVTAPASTPVARPVAAPKTVMVQPGDCLWDIAAAHLPQGASTTAVHAAWQAWYETNRAVIGDDPNLVIPGQELQAPTTVTYENSTALADAVSVDPSDEPEPHLLATETGDLR